MFLSNAFSNLVTNNSYNVSRFFSPNFNALIIKTLKYESFDIVLLESLFTTMKDSIKGTVSLGPGENFLSVFFGNVAKEGSKGDLNVDGKEVELKARTGNTGAVVAPRTYNRGDFTKSVKPFFDKFIKDLNTEPNVEKELNHISELKDKLIQKKIEISGEPTVLVYNSPYKVFNRRYEIIIPINFRKK